MGIFDKILKRNTEPVAAVTNSYPFPCLPISGGVDLVGDKHAAMNIAAVFRCMNIISQGVAQLPMQVKTLHPDGYFEVDITDPLNYLLSVAPNDYQTGYEFRQAIVISLLADGNAYILPEYDPATYEPLRLIRLNNVRFDKNAKTYIVNDMVNHINGIFQPHEIIHIKNISLDGGYTGVSTLAYAAKVMAISANADSDQVRNFKTGGTLRGFVSGKGGQTMGFGQVQQSQLSKVSDDISAEINSGKNIFSLPADMGFNTINMTPQQYQLLESKKFNVLEIARFFGVPADKLFEGQASNYKSSEMSQVAFLTDTLQPILKNIEAAFATKLIAKDEAYTKRIEFNIDSLMQTDLETQAAYIEKTIATGVRTVNYWRKATGMAPVEGGDKALVSANLVPLNSKKLSGESVNE